jgi:hypothetical protein
VSAAQREHDQDAELARLRDLVADQGQALAAMTEEMRRFRAALRLLGLATGIPLPDDLLGDRPQLREPEPEGYESAAAVQARRRMMHAVPAGEVAQ